MAYILEPLPYKFDALEPHIDAKTMEIHHDKHHQTYVSKLNEALEGLDELSSMTIEDLLKNIDKVPADKKQAVINHGGGHANHSLFWKIMTPNGGGQPTGKLADAITNKFGEFAKFQEEFEKAALGRFGSGWAWLALDKNNNIHIMSTANQDSPYLEGHNPLMGVDVWEHAYYLKYQNLRQDYVKAWWNVINWNEIEKRYDETFK